MRCLLLSGKERKGFRKLHTEKLHTETYNRVNPLTEEEIKSIIEEESNAMGYEATFEFMSDIVEEHSQEMKGCMRIEKIMNLIRHAYLHGFAKGIQVYNDTIREIWEPGSN